MRNKLKQFLQSYFGHLVLAFVFYTVFVVFIVLSIKYFVGDNGIKNYTSTAQTNLVNNKLDTSSNSTIRITIIISELGLSKKDTEKAITELPSSITFSFSPYTENLSYWFSESKKFGHELLLEIPMEPENYPDNDSGPLALLTNYSATRNIEILKNIMEKVQGYDGLMSWTGEKFMKSKDSLYPVFEYIKKSELFFINSAVNFNNIADDVANQLKLPYASVNVVLDDIANEKMINIKLKKLETLAKIGSGHAIGIIRPYSISIKMIKDWEKTLDSKGISLVPASVIVN